MVVSALAALDGRSQLQVAPAAEPLAALQQRLVVGVEEIMERQQLALSACKAVGTHTGLIGGRLAGGEERAGAGEMKRNRCSGGGGGSNGGGGGGSSSGKRLSGDESLVRGGHVSRRAGTDLCEPLDSQEPFALLKACLVDKGALSMPGEQGGKIV